MGKSYSVPVHEYAVSGLKVEDHQLPTDLAELTVETADPRITEADITISISTDDGRETIQNEHGCTR